MEKDYDYSKGAKINTREQGDLRTEATSRLKEEIAKANKSQTDKHGSRGVSKTGRTTGSRGVGADVRLGNYGRTGGLKELDPAYHGQGQGT